MKSKKRAASKFSTRTDRRGRRIVRLDVGGGETATLAQADRERVQQQLVRTGTGSGRFYVGAHRPAPHGGLITLARVVAEASRGQRVKYHDGDRLNLLPENLCIVAGAAKRSAIC